MNTNPMLKFDDEIDLRAIFQVLWKGRVLILILTLSFALIAYVVSVWFLPKQYEAVAYITVGRPAVQYQTDREGLSITTFVPDIKALPENANSAIILREVKDDSLVKSLLSLEKGGLPSRMQVFVVGSSQLRFKVVDSDPERAAVIATVWAKKSADWIELTYGLSAFAVTLDDQISRTRENYAEAETTLESFIAQDQSSVLLNQIAAKNDIYVCLEKRIETADSILRRISDLESHLLQSGDPLALADALLLSAIRQDFGDLGNCSDVSARMLIDTSADLFDGISASQGLEIINGLRESLNQRIVFSQAEQQDLQEQLLELNVKSTQYEYQRAEYERRVAQYESLYDQLTFQRTMIDNILQQSGRVAFVSMEAVEPQFSSSPDPLVNTGLGGGFGFVLASLGLLGVELWKKTNRLEQSG